MLSFLKLIRYPNLLMVLITIVLCKHALIDSFILESYLSNLDFILLSFSVISLTAGGYIINDIYDIEADKINKPNKVYINKTTSIKNAWLGYFLLSTSGFVLGCYLSVKNKSLLLFSIYFFTTLVLYFYSKKLKRKPLIGNIVVSLTISLIFILTFIAGTFSQSYSSVLDAILGAFENSILILIINSFVLFSFLTTLIREIIKDIEDIDGDYVIGAKTLPIVIGRKRTNRVVLGFCIILLLFLIIIIREYLINFPYFFGYTILFLVIPTLYFTYKLYSAKTKKDYTFLSKFMKLIMLFGILSMIFFKFI